MNKRRRFKAKRRRREARQWQERWLEMIQEIWPKVDQPTAADLE